MRGYGVQFEREREIAGLPLKHPPARDIGLDLLPFQERMARYESPEAIQQRELEFRGKLGRKEMERELEREEELRRRGLGKYEPKVPKFQYFTDAAGVVTKYNPITGKSISLGKIGKEAAALLGQDIGVRFSPRELRVLEARGINPNTPEGRQQALQILYPLTNQEREAIIASAKSQWKEKIEPTREAVRMAYQKELEADYRQRLKEKGFSVREIAKIILMPWIGIPKFLFGRRVPKPKFDEVEYQKRLKAVNADDATIRNWLKESGITFEELMGVEEKFGIPGL
ncbi:MAG: hypothetical protein DDT42_01607 [candidate division WS2 bacterium]|uniref:Uncharacterized protein n=1 Tax=Psychracetigena formicireducens TaxID=2986056 RepID=A0A9E2BJ22_PSYF1|nr:hypothetical protein [Candidatus Psychracetigena formicireducens]